MPSLHNGLTSNPKLQEAYRRALGEMSQSFSGLERGSESLQPVIDLWALPEWALLRGENIYSRILTLGADAANFSSHELVNPTGSGVLCVVLEILAIVNAQIVSIDVGPALGAVATNRGVANDARRGLFGEVSRCTIVQGHLPAGVTNAQDQIAALERSTHPYVLPPGTKLFVSTGAINQIVQTGFLFTERPLLANEQVP